MKISLFYEFALPRPWAPDDEHVLLQDCLNEVEAADKAGFSTVWLTEHHFLEEYCHSTAPEIFLAAASQRTKNIRLGFGIMHLPPVVNHPARVAERIATLDLLSNGRAEIVAGRGSFIESFPLFGLKLEDYDSLFAEKLDLLLKIRTANKITWSGKHRPALTGQGIYPRPLQNPLPVWLGVGGTPESFVRAGALGLPLMVAIIGGEPHRFRPLVDLYREAGRRAGHAPESLKVGLHMLGYVAKTTAEASDHFFPGYAQTFTEIGKERGWPPTTRDQFEALRRPTGALVVGNPDEVVEKILYVNEALGGIARLNFQMSVATLSHERLLSSTELLGSHVAPAIRKALSAS
jgi:probable LLM family oxidoreductase